MSNLGSMFDLSKLPENAREALNDLYAASSRGINTANLLPQIKMQHGVKKPKFELPGEKEEDELKAVILNFSVCREMYSEDEKNKVPLCTSVGGINGTAFGLCKECPNFGWGTNTASGKKRSCRETRKFVAMVKGYGIMEMRLPSTSINGFDSFKNKHYAKFDHHMALHLVTLKLNTMEQKGRKPWSVIEIIDEGSLQEKDPEMFTEMLDKVVEYKKFYTETPAKKITPATPAPESDTTAESSENESSEGQAPFDGEDPNAKVKGDLSSAFDLG